MDREYLLLCNESFIIASLIIETSNILRVLVFSSFFRILRVFLLKHYFNTVCTYVVEY